MNKLDRFRYGNTRRKNLTIAGIISLAVIILATILLAAVGIFSYRTELVTLRATSVDADNTFGGAGVNLKAVPNVNLISDPSFEMSSDYLTFVVASVDGGAIYLEPEAIEAQGIEGDEMAGDLVRILSIDENGTMTERYTGTCTGYEPARLSSIELLEDAEGLIAGVKILDVINYNNSYTALTEDGDVICNIGSDAQEAALETSGSELIAGIEATDDGVYAAGTQGNIYYAADGRNFSLLSSGTDLDVRGESPVTASSGEVFAAAYKDGTVLTVTDGIVTETQIPAEGKIAFFDASEAGFIAADTKGNVYYSGNGLIYTAVEDDSLADMTVNGISARGSCFYILRDDGEIAVIDTENDMTVTLLDACREDGNTYKSVSASDSGKIILVSDKGVCTAIYADKDESTVFTGENVVVDTIYGISGDRIIYSSAGKLYRAAILSGLSMEGSIPEDAIISGDICIVENGQAPAAVYSVSEDGTWKASSYSDWSCSGAGTSLVTCQRPDGKGLCAMLTGENEGVHVMSQKLNGTSSDCFADDTFYRISLSAMSYNENASIKVWVYGDTFGTQGFVINDLKENFNEYSFVFAVTDSMTADDSIRFSISVDGAYSVLIDEIYLGPDEYAASGIPQYYQTRLSDSGLSVVRLDNLNLGSSGFCRNAFFGMSEDSVSVQLISSEYGGQVRVSACNSLEESLRLVSSCQATPWFVIGSAASQSDIDNFLEYLCGSVSSEYGGKRIDNGTALPWSRQFDKILIEINDSENCFASDTQKASYVDCVMAMFAGSEYYSDVKDKIIFLDGMEYSGGTMISGADCHAIGMNLEFADPEASSLENILSSLGVAQYNSPHVTSSSFGGEYISSLSCSKSINAGEFISLLINDDADFITTTAVDLDSSFVPSMYGGDGVFADPEYAGTILSSVKVVNCCKDMREVYVEASEPLDAASAESVQLLSLGCVWSAYSGNGCNYIVVANPSDTQQNFLLSVSAFLGTGATVDRYSSTGQLLTTRNYAMKSMRYTLQPGEFIIVTIDSPVSE